MARNEVFKYGDWLDLPVAVGTVSGDAVIVGELVGVAQTDRDADGFAAVALTGAFRLPVTGAATVGAPVHIEADGDLTMTSTGNRLFGHALGAKGAGLGDLVVRLAGHAHGAAA
jgi:predicted RecA/RadA family phage recombinase